MRRSLYASFTVSTFSYSRDQLLHEKDDRHIAAYVLDGDEVCPNQGDMIYLAEHADDPRMVNAGNEDSEKVSQKCRLFLKIERERLVKSRIWFQPIDIVRSAETHISTLAARTMTSLN